MSIIVANLGQTFLDPIIALKLYDMGIYADKAGYIYLFLMGSYCVFGISGGLIEKLGSKKSLIYAGYIAGAISYTLIAHNAYLHADFLPLIIIGLILVGFSVIGGNMFATMFTKAYLMEVGEKHGIPKQNSGGYFGGLKGS